MTKVPDTDDFSLDDVYNSVSSHASPSKDLADLFAKAVDEYLDPTYKGNKDNLYNFRNYTPVFEDAPVYDSHLKVYYYDCPDDLDSYTDQISIDDILKNYSGGDWRTLVITDFNKDYDGNGEDEFLLQDKTTGNWINSFPYAINIKGLAGTEHILDFVFMIEYSDICESPRTESGRILFYAIDVYDQDGDGQTYTLEVENEDYYSTFEKLYYLDGLWEAPDDGVIDIECWGAGGAGGDGGGGTSGGGGGAGGQYANKLSVSVLKGEVYDFYVGQSGYGDGGDGGDSYFKNPFGLIICLAKGGEGAVGQLRGNAASIYDGVGDTVNRGGHGADGSFYYSGGGGGGAGTLGSGDDASGMSGGSGSDEYGGDGGNGTDYSDVYGANGNDRGGGGAGATTNDNNSGGSGGGGLIRLKFEADEG